MCGIVACYAWDAPAWSPRLLARMNACHTSRGPDNLQEALLLDGRLGLAHARLSIIDLDPRSNQPMASQDGRRHLVYNGELYNYQALRRELEAAGFAFRTTSDTEVLLHALIHWGEEALPRLEGMFAFVYADLDAGSLLAARDRLGIKPLAWTKVGGSIAIASTVTPLTMVPGFDWSIDPDARYEMLTTKCVPSPLSIYASVHKLPPGSFLKIGFDGDVQERRWWRPGQWFQSGQAVDMASLEQALEASVARQLVADVPVGVFLSGGIDSSLVTALAAKQAGRIKTFSVGFEVEAYNEAPHARAIAAHLGTEHHEYMVTAKELLDVFPRIASMYDEPFGDASAVPTYCISSIAREQVTVVLSGDGGDEQYFGYSRFHNLAKVYPVIGCFPKWFRRLARLFPIPGPRSRVENWRHSLLGYQDATVLYPHYVYTWYGHLADYVLGGGRGRYQGLAVDAGRTAYAETHGDFYNAMMLTDMAFYLPEDCLTKVDRASMATSLEVRVPLLDELALRQTLAMPLAGKWRHGKGKFALREILSRHVPRELFERPKMGFGVPLDRWLFGELRDFTESLLSKENCLAAGLDYEAVKAIAEQHRQGKQDHQYFLWPVCCLIDWMQKSTERRTALEH